MTKPNEDDILLAKLMEGETVESVMESLGLSREEANRAITRANITRLREQGRDVHINACTQWIECIINGCSCPCHG